MNRDVIKKLRITSGQRLAILNPPEGYLDDAAAVLEGVEWVTEPSQDRAFDAVHLFVKTVAELQAWGPKAIGMIKYDGLLWVSYPKKSSKIKSDLSRDYGWDVLTSAGLEGVSLVSIDDTWSAMRYRPAEKVKVTSTQRAARRENGSKA